MHPNKLVMRPNKLVRATMTNALRPNNLAPAAAAAAQAAAGQQRCVRGAAASTVSLDMLPLAVPNRGPGGGSCIYPCSLGCSASSGGRRRGSKSELRHQ